MATNEFKNAMKSQNRQILGVLRGENIEIRNELESFKIETAAQPFATSMRKISAKLLGVNFDLQGKIITPNFSANGQNIELEPFEITEVKIDLEAEKTEITGYDKMLKTHKEFDTSRHNFPCSMREFVAQIAESCGLVLGENFSLNGGDLEIPIDYYAKISKITYRDILRQIAEVAGGIFLIKNGKLAFKPLKNAETIETITEFDLRKITLTEATKPLNSLVLSRTPQEDNIYFRASDFNGENLSELKIANNEIVDKRRSEVAEAIFGRISGLNWQGFKAETFGFGYLTAGDRVRFSAGGKQFESFIFNSVLEVSQGVKENFETAVLTPTITNYKRASDIVKKLYNTEIVVDKQKQYIESVVSEQTTKNGQIDEKFSRLTQNLEHFDYQIQKSGGLNLLKNSAFWSFDNNHQPNFWQIEGDNPIFQSSPEAKSKGSISGRIVGVFYSRIRQTVPVVIGEKYSFSAKVKKGIMGNFSVHIFQNGVSSGSKGLSNGTESFYDEIKIENIEAEANEITIEISNDYDDGAFLTDLMLANNEKAQTWTMAQGEIANSNVIIDEKGLTVKSSINEGDYTAITPLEFSGYSRVGSSVERVFSLNKDTTEVKKLKAEDELNMTPIKIVAIKDGETTGWAFVKNKEDR